MKLKDINLGDRYKKLKQSDRMEYLAINSIYEKKEVSYFMTLMFLLGIKIFILIILFILTYILSGGGNILNILLKDFLIALVIGIPLSMLILYVELSMFLLLFLNDRTRKNMLNEFLLDRKIK